MFVHSSYFDDIDSAIRVTKESKFESIISKSFFSRCYSGESGGAIFLYILNGDSQISFVCGLGCFSSSERHFGRVQSCQNNQVNFSSFVLCAPGSHVDQQFGSISILYGRQIINEINSTNNNAKIEAGIVIFYQEQESRMSFLICKSCKAKEKRILQLGNNTNASYCTVIESSSTEFLVYSHGSFLYDCQIIDCNSDYAIGCNTGKIIAYEVFINNGLKIDESVTVKSFATSIKCQSKTWMCYDSIKCEVSYEKRRRILNTLVFLSIVMGESKFLIER